MLLWATVSFKTKNNNCSSSATQACWFFQMTAPGQRLLLYIAMAPGSHPSTSTPHPPNPTPTWPHLPFKTSTAQQPFKRWTTPITQVRSNHQHKYLNCLHLLFCMISSTGNNHVDILVSTCKMWQHYKLDLNNEQFSSSGGF